MKPRIILLISIDTLRADHLGCYGYPRNTSPCLDEFSNDCTVFRNAFTTCSYTLPAHASLFTGHYPSSHSVGFNQSSGRLSPDVDITLAEILKCQGYHTAAFVSSFVLRKETHLNLGFDHYDDEMTLSEVNRSTEFIRSSSDTNKRFLKWLGDPTHDRRFAFVHYFDAHGPYVNPPEYQGLFVRDAWYGEEKLLDLVPEGRPGGIPEYQALNAVRDVSGTLVQYERDHRYYVAEYDAGIRRCDDSVRVVFDELKRLGLYDEALIIVTSDHGESLGENSVYFFHGLTLTPDQIQVPLLVKLPGRPGSQPAHVSNPVSLVDVLPTVSEMVNVRTGIVTEGCSLWGCLSGGGGRRSPIGPEKRLLVAELEGQIAFIEEGLIRLKPRDVQVRHHDYYYQDSLIRDPRAIELGQDEDKGELVSAAYDAAQNDLRRLRIEQTGTIEILKQEVMRLYDAEDSLRSEKLKVDELNRQLRDENEMLQEFAEKVRNTWAYRLYQAFIKPLKSIGEVRRLPFGAVDVVRQRRGWKAFFRALHSCLSSGRFWFHHLNKQYAKWQRKNNLTEPALSRLRIEARTLQYSPKISILVPTFNANLAFLDEAVGSVRSQIYENWEMCIVDDGSGRPGIKERLDGYASQDGRIKIKGLPSNQGISAASNEALSMATGEFLGLLDHDDCLSAEALFEMVKVLNRHPEADMIYSDEDKISQDGNRCDPYFKPDWSPDLFMSCMYTCHFGVYRKSLVDSIGGFRRGYDGSQDYDLVLRLMERTERIFHVPKILYHWRKATGSVASTSGAKLYAYQASRKALQEALERRGISGSILDGPIPGYYRLQRSITGSPLVSVIIPTRDQFPILDRCIRSISRRTLYHNYEVIVVDNGSQCGKTRAYLQELSQIPHVRVLSYEKPFNFSAINNYAAASAKGDYLLFLNNDTEVVSDEWITALLEHAQRKEVGAVGCKLLYPDKRVQHAGVILGINGVAGHAYRGQPSQNNIIYYLNLDAIRNYSAVTAACMMMRKAVFREVGGFDEQHLPVSFNDVDLCLRLRERGYLIVYTPYAVLYHHEGASRGFEMDQEEVVYMRKRWRDLLDRDPYYNPNMSMSREDFSLRV